MSETSNNNQFNSEKLWVGLEHYHNDPKFLELAQKEFLSSPLSGESNGEFGRREFLKLMGASIALASTSCIRRPANKIVPYVKRPAEVVPGVANYYATSWLDSGQGFGMVIKTREGRPIKAEGLLEHPVNMGGLSARAQAHVLSVYDPDRAREPKKNIVNEGRTNSDSVDITWEAADDEIIKGLEKGKVRILSGTLASPSTEALISEFSQAFGAKHFVWDSLDADDVKEGQSLCYGQEVVPRYRFDKAKLVVSFGADFLGTHLSPVEYTKQFAKSRHASPLMSQLVMFESLYSLTGANADTRVSVAGDQLFACLMGLIYEIVVVNKKSNYAGRSEISKWLEPYSNVSMNSGVSPEVFQRLAKELWENKGESLVISGGINVPTHQAVPLQIATNFLNSLLENDGKTIDATHSPNKTYKGSFKNLARLIEEMKSGQVSTLIIHRANPLYALPESSGFRQALNKVKMVIYTGDRNDETGKVSNLFLPDHHALENWGDGEFQKQVYSIQQPTIRPMYNTRAFQDSLLAWMNLGGSRPVAKNWHAYLVNYWKSNIYGQWTKGAKSFEEFWTDVLQTGVRDVSNLTAKRTATSASRSFNVGALRSAQVSASTSGTKLLLYAKVGMGDGSMANISWIQEFPDPVTKITWDNYLTVSESYANKNQLKEGSVVQVTANGFTEALPVHIQPGQNSNVLGLAIGYGRRNAGNVASESGLEIGDRSVGQNAFLFSSIQNGQWVRSGMDVKIKIIEGKHHPLACTQGHHMLRDKKFEVKDRDIIAHTTLSEYLKNKSAGIHHHGELKSIWPEHKYTGHKWAMVIDSNSCTGCSACVVACQSENNIPSVGKRYVLEGREMHWLRIDRYYKGDPEAPQTLHQPMLCQHCDNAPCETVCPVVATSHSSEGLNEMVYNRCVGTRYCSNNCPYKVRRFNWFNYIEHNDTLKQALNPEVTVRSRGVMEKCTFCVQRIKEAKQIAQDKKVALADGDIKTACQQSCPADAISFGDSNDKSSVVSQLFHSERASTVLEELYAKPSIRYLTKISNPLIHNSGSHDGAHGEAQKEGGH